MMNTSDIDNDNDNDDNRIDDKHAFTTNKTKKRKTQTENLNFVCVCVCCLHIYIYGLNVLKKMFNFFSQWKFFFFWIHSLSVLTFGPRPGLLSQSVNPSLSLITFPIRKKMVVVFFLKKKEKTVVNRRNFWMMEITRFSLFCPHFSHHVLTFDSKNNIDIIAIVDDKVVVWKLTWMIFIKISSSSIIGNRKL